MRGGNYRWGKSFGNKFRQVNLRGSEADAFIFEGEGDDPGQRVIEDDGRTGVTGKDGVMNLQVGTIGVVTDQGANGGDVSFLDGPIQLIGVGDDHDIIGWSWVMAGDFKEGMGFGGIEFDQSQVEVLVGFNDLNFQDFMFKGDSGSGGDQAMSGGDGGIYRDPGTTADEFIQDRDGDSFT